MENPRVFEIYKRLFYAYGPQHWWPGETRLEVIVGAVLTQNTSWQNVEKAIYNMKKAGLLELKALADVRIERLAELIKPSGYYNIKADRLKEVILFFSNNGGIESFLSRDADELRESLLGIKGVGEETADSIILYAFEKPVFVVDAYTKRVFSRLGLIPEGAAYPEVKSFFEEVLPRDASLFNEYHALIVRLGKELCRKKDPLCHGCSIKSICTFSPSL